MVADISNAVLSDCSAKALVRGEPNVSYICSRYYRAPELILGASDYTVAIGIGLSLCCIYIPGPALCDRDHATRTQHNA